jgi:peptidoglycan/xylan/chitin deacetylase (PgdA/CDA1 family)
MTDAFRTDAVAHLSIAGVLGVLIALTLQHSTDTTFTIGFAALAAFGLGALLRRSVPRPSLALLGWFVALVAAWLIPQRPDPASGIILAGVFGIGAALAAPVVRRPRPSVLALALGALIVVALAGSRPIVLGVAVVAVLIAAVVSRFGRFGFPRTHRLRTLALGSTLVIAVSGLTGYFGASTVGATWFGGGVVHGPRASDQVAITFDEGPDVSATPAILKILDAAKVKGSFFVVGKTLDTSPQVVRDLVADGQLVGNHSYHHDEWRWLDPRYPELERTQKAFGRLMGTCPVWFRPPHGQRTPLMARVVKDHRMRMAMWDVAVSDRGKNDPKAIADKVLAAVKGGSIIDLHAGLDGTSSAHRAAVVAALPLILDGLRTRGLHPVRLDQLVGGPAYQSCDSTRS